jgi:hypothetical protein
MTSHTTTLRHLTDEDYAIDCAACGCVQHGRGQMFTLVEAQRHTAYFDRKR